MIPQHSPTTQGSAHLQVARAPLAPPPLTAPRLFRQMARGRADSIDAAESSWAARSFTAFHAQRISVAIHVPSAAEILRNLRTTTTELARRS